MDILLTGGAGFIGAHVAAALIKEKHNLVIIDNFNSYYDPGLKEARYQALVGNAPVTLYRIDISDEAAVQKIFSSHHFDAVCHLAAQAGVRYSLDHPTEYIQSNMVGTHNLLEAARQHNVTKFIFASSSSVYGDNTKTPFTETDPVDHPISLYAATKKANELEAYTYHHLFGLQVSGLRFFSVYGPWGRPDMAYFKFTKLITSGQPIDVYNQGKMARDFTYVDDVVTAVVTALNRCQGYEIFNLGNNHPIPLETLITLIENKLGTQAIKNYLPIQPGDVVATCADIAKAQQILQYQPKTTIEDGLNQFIDWYKHYYHV